MRRAHQGSVVAEFSRILGKPQSFDGRLDARARDQNFIRRSGFPRDFQYFTALVIREHDGLAGRAQHHQSSRRSFRVALNIVLDLFEVHIAVGIKRRREGRKNTV